ncbi:serine hydrolase domain-containing protein [Saccharicrinis fermentans]|uniref:Putative periplasmic esterase n=1 Tax=Saccharicrinis fermentans DSM 9555 = JCM 21142 TaxID=869213 RepID=W7YA75_9BACT|nr:serine hydrolase [Saccharicrinis fermentans]GAF05227.1 putative periplasmic esterase [Saccharicrinis fermentans DSM 9555 = JCM 21142]
MVIILITKKRHVETSDLYDIASVTKIVSSIPAIMKMYDEGRIELDDSLSHLIPRLKGSNKAGLKLDDIMIHQAGLQSWIPFYLRAIDKERLKGDIYSRRYSSLYNIKVDKSLYMNRTVRYRTDVFRHSSNDDFNIQVSAGLYMNKGYLDSMRMGIDTSQVQANPTYRYSDLGYYYLKEIIENKYNKSQDVVVENTFYKPLGAERLMYLPLRKFNKREIVPTENDVSFRKELIHGYVHDPGAAMLGGVGGHAGVFASAEDLAKMLQMYLNNGYYGGERYIDSSTINIFTSVVKEGNRRGLGFDKPILDPKVSGPTCREVSPSSYGHSGFTGTLVWMDPEYDLMYIFLSNRIHPNQYNKKLISGDVRTNIQSAIYRSLPEYWEKTKRK